MLGRFDPLLLAHRDKSWVVPDEYYDRVWRPAGHIEAVVLVHGRAVATWRYDRLGAGTLAVRVFPFKRPLPRHVGMEVRRQAKEAARFFRVEVDGGPGRAGERRQREFSRDRARGLTAAAIPLAYRRKPALS